MVLLYLKALKKSDYYSTQEGHIYKKRNQGHYNVLGKQSLEILYLDGKDQIPNPFQRKKDKYSFSGHV